MKYVFLLLLSMPTSALIGIEVPKSPTETQNYYWFKDKQGMLKVCATPSRTGRYFDKVFYQCDREMSPREWLNWRYGKRLSYTERNGLSLMLFYNE